MRKFHYNYDPFLPVTSLEGDIVNLTKVTRSEMGAYLCIAANGVPPSVSKRIMLHVHCKYLYLITTFKQCSRITSLSNPN